MLHQPPASSSLEELQAKANMITDPGQETALQRAAVDPGMQPVSGEGPQPTIYDPATVAAGDPGTMRFEVTRVEQEGKILWALGNGYYGDTNAGEGKLPFVQDDGEWRIDRSWVCALTQRPPEGVRPPSARLRSFLTVNHLLSSGAGPIRALAPDLH